MNTTVASKLTSKADQAALNARDDEQRSAGWLGAKIQIEIIANDTTITSRSVVSHVVCAS